MQVTETNAEGLRREFKVVFPASELGERMEARLKELSGQVNIPGFRPGKVPAAIIKARFGEAVRGEVIEQALNEGASRTLEEQGVRPATQPKVEVDEFEEGKDLAFTMAVEVLPTIEPADFAGYKLERMEPEADDAAVDEALAGMAKQYGHLETVEEKRAGKEGDVLVIDFTGRVDGEEFEGGKAEDFHLALGSGTFIPGFEDQLTGAKAGEAKDVTVTFPADYGNADLAGKEAVFEVAVKEIKESVASEIDDEFAKQLGHEGVDGLRAAIREQIESSLKDVARGRVKRVLFDRLDETHEFPLPESMVEMEFESIWQRVEQDKEAGQLEADDEGKSDEELRAEYRGIAERRVKLGLLLSEVGTRNNISVAQEEVNRAMMEQVRNFPGQAEQVIEFYRSNPQAMDQLRAPLFEEKVVDFILEMAQVTPRKVSREELMAADEEGEAKTEKKAKKPAKKAAAKKAKPAAKDEPEAKATAKKPAKKKAAPKKKAAAKDEAKGD
ncbi:MAG: trigger factor [Rhodospirillaceae bacterium]|jgi:trigger factor|nr:trigger factor [Rhodospirillaceae bacterium]MBT6119143.1 trigger factor [Rhodospirillaceae bacterium]